MSLLSSTNGASDQNANAAVQNPKWAGSQAFVSGAHTRIQTTARKSKTAISPVTAPVPRKDSENQHGKVWHKWVSIQLWKTGAASGVDLMLKQRKILLAEDEQSLCRYIVMLLNRWDCEVAVEQTGEGAIRRAAVFQPDIALLGFVTPGIDGAQAGIGLLKVSPGTNVVLFNESVPASILSDLRVQGYDFQTLTAPFTDEELRASCFAMLKKRR